MSSHVETWADVFSVQNRIITMDLFVTRCCPFCSATDSETLCEMSIETLLQSNPGYNPDWFHNGPVGLGVCLPFVRCAACRFVYVRERLNDDLMKAYYNEGINATHSEAKIYKWQKRNSFLQLWARLHGMVQTDELKVVDFGAGWGDFLAIARSAGVSGFGLEFDQRKILAASKFGVELGDLDFVKTRAPYDLFFCNQVLEHLDDPRNALDNLRSLLRSGATGYISVPDFPSQRIAAEVAALQNGELPSKDFDPLGHLNYFDGDTFVRLLCEHGFEVVDSPRQVPHRRWIWRCFTRVPAASPKSTACFARAV